MSTRKRFSVSPWLLAIALGAGGGALWQLAGSDPQAEDTAGYTANDGAFSFSLSSADGPVSFADSAGRLRLVYFGYMSCPDVCPTTLSRLGGALYQLSETELASVQPYFISVDPERDTPQNLALYSHYFHPAITGLTGSREAVDSAVNALQAYYRIEPLDGSAMGYSIDHSANVFLLDGAGHLIETFPDTLAASEIVARVRHYL